MNGARLLGAALPLLSLTAALLLAAYAAAHRPRRPMPYQAPVPPHRIVVEAALDDWWITTDPAAPFHTPDVAAHIKTYLISSGYTISPDLRRNSMPSRRAITTVLALAVMCATSTVFAAIRGDWWWTIAGATATGALTWEGIRDLGDRRKGRNAR